MKVLFSFHIPCEPTIAVAMNYESKALKELTLVAGWSANRRERCRIQQD